VLGRFLELGIVTADPGAAWEQLQRLGFAGATSGEVWRHAYGVVACEGLAIGLHAAGDEALSLFFVKPDVAALERELADRLIGIEGARLGEDVFHELALREPGGTLLRVIEARTFSPPQELPARTALGTFRALSLPCADLAEALGFWERLDMDLREMIHPWEGLAVEGLPLAYHASSSFKEPVLLFDGIDDDALRDSSLASGRSLPALRDQRHRLFRGPEGLAMLLLEQEERRG
jgi:hypothetical protein